ncbi:MAG: insulinase family protein, partial [Nitrospirae bacterium]
MRGRLRHGQPREDGRLQSGLVHREAGRPHRVVRLMPQRIVVLLLSLILLASLASAANLEERVVEHRLANGLTLLLMERHHAPIVAVNLTYKVGGVYEHSGITGVAHLYEHMAFKGTRTIGVTDAEKEKPVLEEL